MDEIVKGVSAGVGYTVVGPMAGGALDAPVLRAALRDRLVEVALWVGVGVAGGVVAGLVLGRLVAGGSR